MFRYFYLEKIRSELVKRFVSIREIVIIHQNVLSSVWNYREILTAALPRVPFCRFVATVIGKVFISQYELPIY